MEAIGQQRKSVLGVLISHIRSIIFVSAIFGLLVGLHAYTRPEVYQAQAVIVPPISILSKGVGMGDSGMGGNAAFMRQMMGQRTLSDMYAEILRSRRVANALVSRFDLADVYGVPSKPMAERLLVGHTTIEVKYEGAVVISVRDADPNRAASLANGFVSKLDEINKEFTGMEAANKSAFLKNRLGEIRQDLSNIEKMPSREAVIKEMLFETLTREYELARMEEAWNMPTIQVLDHATAPDMRMPRGTVRKTMMTGVFAAFFVSGFWLLREGVV